MPKPTTAPTQIQPVLPTVKKAPQRYRELESLLVKIFPQGGLRTMPKALGLLAIADLFGIPPEYLFAQIYRESIFGRYRKGNRFYGLMQIGDAAAVDMIKSLPAFINSLPPGGQRRELEHIAKPEYLFTSATSLFGQTIGVDFANEVSVYVPDILGNAARMRVLMTIQSDEFDDLQKRYAKNFTTASAVKKVLFPYMTAVPTRKK